MARLLTILVMTGLAGSGPAGSQPGLAPVEARVPFAPAAFVSDGLTRLAYELHITNFYRSSGTLRLTRLEVLAPNRAAPIALHEGEDLASRIIHPRATPPPVDPLAIAGGLRVVVYMWITVPLGERVPSSLRHRIVFTTDTGEVESVDGVQVDVRGAAPPVLGAPFREGTWFVANGPGNHRAHHWGGLLAANGRISIPQRFAMDLMGLDPEGRAVRGDLRTSANQDWIGYGAEVIAVGDGVVREIQDGEPEKAPLAPNPPTAPTFRASGGNYVILDLGQNVLVLYAHLQPQSLRVTKGSRVRRGQTLGRLGNSGSTTAPHLHLHVTDTLTLEGSEGLPFVFQSFEALGQHSVERALGVESDAKPANFVSSPRERELPLDGAVIRFGSRR